MPEIDLHEALAGHWVVGPDGLQMSAHCDGVLEGGFSSAQVGVAVAPVGAPGHGDEAEHPGEQNDPATPVICTADSPAAHGPALGSSYALPPGAGGAGGAGPGFFLVASNRTVFLSYGDAFGLTEGHSIFGDSVGNVRSVNRGFSHPL